MSNTDNLIDSEFDNLVDHECFEMIHDQMPYVLTGITLAAIGTCWILSYSIDQVILRAWFILFCLVTVSRYFILIFKDYFRTQQLKISYVLGSFFSGLLWSAIFLIVSSYQNLETFVILAALATGTSTVALVTHAHYPPAYYAYIIPTLLGLNIAYFRYDIVDTAHAVAAVTMTTALFFLLIRYCRDIHRSTKNSIRLKMKNQALLVETEAQALLAKNSSIDKSRFFAAVSHDLRQPFHALNLFVNSIVDSSLDPHTKNIVDNIKLSINAQARQFNEFLDMSKLDAGTVIPKTSCFSTKTLLDELQLEYQNIAEQKGLAFSSSSQNFLIKSDPLLCRRIIRNLLSNAFAYTEEGGISIEITATEKNVSIAVIDTGIGIDRDNRETIFSEFEQLNNPERDSNQGLGLGLAIVKRHCDLLELEIKVASVTGQGTTFTIFFERCLEETPKIKKRSIVSQVNLKSATILVVDDDTLILKATESLLEGLGHKVFCAHDLEEAINVLRSNSIKPDLILCDLRLKDDQTGIDVIQQLNEYFNEYIPSIIITGETDLESIESVLKTDSLLLHKPIQKAKLVMAVNSMLKDESFNQ